MDIHALRREPERKAVGNPGTGFPRVLPMTTRTVWTGLSVLTKIASKAEPTKKKPTRE